MSIVCCMKKQFYYRTSDHNAVSSSALQQVGGSEWSVSLDTISLLLQAYHTTEMSVCLSWYIRYGPGSQLCTSTGGR